MAYFFVGRKSIPPGAVTWHHPGDMSPSKTVCEWSLPVVEHTVYTA